MTAVELVNVALTKLGITRAIAATNEASREAYTAGLVYDTNLRATLRRFPWPFATKYATLALARGRFWNTDPTALTAVDAWKASYTYEPGDVVRVGGINYYNILESLNQTPPNATYWSTAATDAPTQANGDWLYAYRYPSDCLFGRRLVPPGGDGRAFNDAPLKYRLGRDDNSLLIYTNEQDAVLEYTMVDCTDLWSDDLFLDAFTWRLAMAMAPGLDRSQKSAAECLQMFELTINIAEAVAMKEGQQHPDGDPDWIRHR